MNNNNGYYGVSFPFRIGGKGGVVMSGTNIDSCRHIEESIQQILSTRQGERVMEYHFGSNLDTALFEPDDVTLHNLLKYEIIQALKDMETRIKLIPDDIRIFSEEDEEGIISIYAEIPYYVKDYTNSKHTSIIKLGGE